MAVVTVTDVVETVVFVAVTLDGDVEEGVGVNVLKPVKFGS